MKSRNQICWCLIVLLVTNFCMLQRDFPKRTELYFGQKPPGTTPEIFASGIVSTGACELHGSFSPDGKEFFFTRRATFEGSDNRLMYLREEDGIWTKSQLAPFAEDCVELFSSVSPDGKKVFFLSERAHPVTGKIMKNDEKIWYSEKTKSGWGAARFLEGPVNRGWLLSVASAKNGTLYLSGEFGSQGGIFQSKLENYQYQNVEYLFDGAHPYVSPEESYIVFDRWDKDGNSALYVSFKDEAGHWNEAIKLGPEVNATKTEAFAEVSPDGKILFFHRDGDIYWVSTKIIEQLRPKG